ncbi:MAG: hypothetical protein M1482_15860, partial [Chloroflexi bacterium]|nr:hypothetical protein [Chloroflexota bacterium]
MTPSLGPIRARAPLVALAMLSLLAALWAGLLRLGWSIPSIEPALAGAHAPLMVAGFLGTLISLERAVAIGRRWMFAAPILNAAGAALVAAGVPPALGALLVTLGSAGMVAINLYMVRRQAAAFTIVMALGALVWLVGNTAWLFGAPIFRVVLCWAVFLVLTIVGERLELSRLMQHGRTAEIAFAGAVAIVIAGTIVDLGIGLAMPADSSGIGSRLAGIGMMGLALWLLRNDIARRTVRQQGVTRFTALALLGGYVWLMAGGALRLTLGQVVSGTGYDAVLHTVFVGFVLSMIFGHAPIILPAVLGRATKYESIMYGHLALLHLSLIVRITGDLSGSVALWQWGGLLNALAVVLFLGITAHTIVAGGSRV